MIGAPFQAGGSTFAVTVTGSSSTAVQATSTQNASNYLLTNVGTQTVWVVMSATSPGAAVIPVPGTPQNAIPILPNTYKVVAGSPNAWFVTIAASTGSTLYITPGDGN